MTVIKHASVPICAALALATSASPVQTAATAGVGSPVKSAISVINANGSGLTRILKGEYAFLDLEWLAGGKLSYVSTAPPDGYSKIFLINSDGSDRAISGASPKDVFDKSWSRDETKIAYTYTTFRSTSRVVKPTIYAMNSDGSNRRIVTRRYYVNNLELSPDGNRIAFAGSRSYTGSGPNGVYIVNADGSGLRRLWTTTLTSLGIAWSPDGQALAFTTYLKKGSAISVINVDGSGLKRLLKLRDTVDNLDWTPDGQRLAYSSLYSSLRSHRVIGHIYIMNSDGSARRKILDSIESPILSITWSPDSQKIAFSH